MKTKRKIMRFFIELAYRGTNFHGWQRQPNAPTVQQTIEEGLSTILATPCEIVGCGRTDTGVHSSFFVAHFDYEGTRNLDSHFVYHLNSFLTKDIAISRIYPCDKHARFDATEREYKYVISRKKDPFSQGHAWTLTMNLDVELMQKAADKLLEYSDFSAFEKLHSDNKTSICKISKAQWQLIDDKLVFTIVADRFLRGMIRLIVGTLVDVGKGKISVDDFQKIIESGDCRRASGAAPSDGLYLNRIEY